MKYICIFLLLLTSYTSKAIDSTKLVLHFPFNDHKLTPQSFLELKEVLQNFQTSQDSLLNISIEGHTDQIGSVAYNQNLSVQRANETYKYITDLFGKLVTKRIAFGKSKLITTDTTANEIKEPLIEKPVYAPPRKIKDILNDTAIQVGDTVELPYILFVGGLHDFLPISYPHLDELFFSMKDNPNLEIEIQGHICCAAGTDDGIDFSTGRNNLSVARARAVYDFLTISGIDAKRVTYKGFGHQFPLTKERNEQEKTRNRRVEIKILKK
ncbi:MAG: OmpA family protein [Bacteroidetes bacterium]|nr:OmpA family protein [Bacteroidota bacterium]